VTVASKILNSKTDKSKLSWRERKEYIERVARSEAAKGIDDKLSATLNDETIQNLAESCSHLK
jgi:hypothetical protein